MCRNLRWTTAGMKKAGHQPCALSKGLERQQYRRKYQKAAQYNQRGHPRDVLCRVDDEAGCEGGREQKLRFH